MEIIKKSVPSSDLIHNLEGIVYVPNNRPVGYFHIVHGMTEYIGRYDGFMRKMCEAGFVCFGYDNLGHGYTAREGELGFIGEKDAWKNLCLDVELFASAVRQEYGDMPYYLMGHSMGSFIVRIAVTMTSKPDRLIVMGTGGPNSIAGIGLGIINITKLIRGKKHRSSFLKNVAFGSYCKRFKDENDIVSWLTKDKSIREKYIADPFCNYLFTASAMGDLVTLTKKANSKEMFEKTSKEMPILLISGNEDPVGDYGEGVRRVFDLYSKAGCNVHTVLYDGCRHEILNDTCREEAADEILRFALAEIILQNA